MPQTLPLQRRLGKYHGVWSDVSIDVWNMLEQFLEQVGTCIEYVCWNISIDFVIKLIQVLKVM